VKAKGKKAIMRGSSPWGSEGARRKRKIKYKSLKIKVKRKKA